MARKKKRSSRKKFTGVNVLKLAETYAITNIWTERLLKVNPIEAVTGVVGGKYNPGRDGGAVITLPELFGAGPGGVGGNYGSYASGFTEAVTKNMGGFEGLAMAGIQTGLTSAGFRIFSKVTRRPRSMLNSQLKAFGLGDIVRV